MSAKIILPVAYDGNSVQTNSIVSGEKFTCKKKFTIFSSKPIPAYAKVYMEFTINQHPSDSLIRHLPIYVGVHKEPSIGVMTADLCLGSIYYCNPYYYDNPNDYSHPTSFQYIERYNQNAKLTITKNTQRLGSRVPMVKHVIGIGVDRTTNTISIYVEGQRMYSFQPTTFSLTTDLDDFYFCLHFPLDDTISGSVNFGRYKCLYTPEDYWTLYQQHFYKQAAIWDIYTTIQAGEVYPNPPIEVEPFWIVNLKVENDIAPINWPTQKHRNPYLIYSDEPNLKYANNPLAMKLFSPELNNDIATLCWPIPTDQKIYLEFVAKNALMQVDSAGLMLYNGIPVRIGLTSKINNLVNQNVNWIEMAHKKNAPYKKHSLIYNVDKIYNAGTVLNPLIPIQPDTWGMIFDLANNKIEIYTNGDLFMKVDLKDHNFGQYQKLYWMFIQPITDAFYTDPNASDFAHIIVNTGEKDDMKYTSLYDNKDVMTYYYYYNYLLRNEINYDINITIQTLPYKTNYSKYIAIEVNVPDPEEENWSPGMNVLWKTYNVVTDEEPHNNESDITAFDMWKKVNDDANSWNKRT